MSGKKPKHNYLSQLTNRAVTDRVPHNRQIYENFHKTVLLTPHQKILLNKYIVNENRFYNTLVDILQPKLKNTPEFFSELTEEQIKLFSILAYYGFDVRTIIGKKSTDVDLPERLIPFKNVLFGIYGDKERGLSDKLVIFYEKLSTKVPVWPNTRENMASEMIDFCVKQSKILRSGKIFNSSNTDNAYKFNSEVLENMTLMQKRHLQLLRKDVDIKWFEEKEATLIKIPYLKLPIVIKGINILDQYKHWNFLIIHQDRNEIILNKAEWEIDFKTTFNKYLIKYVESVNPIAQMKSRYVR